MATLKDHQQAMVDLLATGSGIPASASRLAHAMHDVLEIVANSDLMQFVQKERIRVRELNDATTPGLNDKALSKREKACRPKATRFNVNINLADMDEVKMTLQNMQSHLDGARDSRRKAERRVKQLENTIRQLKVRNEELKDSRDAYKAQAENFRAKLLPEQAGCRKYDTQCLHTPIRGNDGGTYCADCGEEL